MRSMSSAVMEGFVVLVPGRGEGRLAAWRASRRRVWISGCLQRRYIAHVIEEAWEAGEFFFGGAYRDRGRETYGCLMTGGGKSHELIHQLFILEASGFQRNRQYINTDTLPLLQLGLLRLYHIHARLPYKL